jgi:hypothetical protein
MKQHSLLEGRQPVVIVDLVMWRHEWSLKHQAFAPDRALSFFAVPISSRSLGTAKFKTASQNRLHSGVSSLKTTPSPDQIDRVT